jgi:hypothetical protein
MPACKCHRCGEDITAIYWHEGKMYGYSCIRYVNPFAKKNKAKEHWIMADVSSLDLTIEGNKQFVNVCANGKKYRFLALRNYTTKEWESIDPYAKVINGYLVCINIAAFKGYEKSKS